MEAKCHENQKFPRSLYALHQDLNKGGESAILSEIPAHVLKPETPEDVRRQIRRGSSTLPPPFLYWLVSTHNGAAPPPFADPGSPLVGVSGRGRGGS